MYIFLIQFLMIYIILPFKYFCDLSLIKKKLCYYKLRNSKGSGNLVKTLVFWKTRVATKFPDSLSGFDRNVLDLVDTSRLSRKTVKDTYRLSRTTVKDTYLLHDFLVHIKCTVSRSQRSKLKAHKPISWGYSGRFLALFISRETARKK